MQNEENKLENSSLVYDQQTGVIEDSIVFKIPFFDVDAMQVAWHGNYIKYMENGRGELLGKLGMPYTEIHKVGYFLPVISVQVKYIRPCIYNQLVRLITRLEPCENILIFKYTLIDEETGKKLMQAETRQLAMDKETREAMFVLPDYILKCLKMK